MTENDLDDLETYCAEQSRDDFYKYRQYNSGFKLKTNWFVREISKAIEQFYKDYAEGKRPVLIIQAPPQHGKSEAVTDAITWMVGKNPDLRFIYASFSERLGIRANLKIQRTITRKRYARIFPETQINDRQTVTSLGFQRNKEMIEFVDRQGSFRNTTVRGSITGETLDIGVIDDPMKGREEANSKTIRDKTWAWFTDDFMTRFDEYGGLLIILTRWHVDDPIGRLIEQDPSVKVLSYKAIAEEDEPHRKEGEALFPAHKSLDFLLARKAAMPAGNWASLYQQTPVIAGGNLFKDEYWRYYEKLPIIKHMCIYGDTAQKTAQANDYTVFQLWGKSEEGKAYLLDQVRGKWEAPELLVNARAFWNKSAGVGRVRAFKIEDKVSGTGLIQSLKRENIPVQGIPRSTDKITRAMDAIPLVENGLVYLPLNAPWLSDYLGEFVTFPNGTHDDQVDPTIDAINDMLATNSPAELWERMI